MSKENDIEIFMQMLRDKSANVADGPVSDLFKGVSPFRVVCIKCKTLEVDILGERGGCGTPQTGSWPGSLTLKCRKCGAAESCDDVF